MADAEIGRLLDALDAGGDADGTLIVFTSDHGEGMGEHHMVRKSFMYDSAARVPLMFCWPGRVRQNISEETELASGADIVPTLCDFMGIPAPPDMRGVSLRPILEGGSPAARPVGDFVVCEDSHAPGRIAAMGRMVRSKRYKYIRYLTDENEQLFDLRADPGEQRNLARDPASRSALASHRDMLLRWEKNLKLAPRCMKSNGDLWRGGLHELAESGSHSATTGRRSYV
jgi:arylsulfatase A-like enzyme